MSDRYVIMSHLPYLLFVKNCVPSTNRWRSPDRKERALGQSRSSGEALALESPINKVLGVCTAFLEYIIGLRVNIGIHNWMLDVICVPRVLGMQNTNKWTRSTWGNRGGCQNNCKCLKYGRLWLVMYLSISRKLNLFQKTLERCLRKMNGNLKMLINYLSH